MAYKQNFKSPILKALVGKQGNLPQHLQDAIKAAPESPAKKDKPSKYGKKHDRLIRQAVKAEDKQFKSDPDGGPFDVRIKSDKKYNRLQKKSDRKRDKARSIREEKRAETSPAKMKDLSGDGKVTKKDVLIGRGVLNKDGSPAKKNGPGKRGKSNKLSTAQAMAAGYVEAGSRDTKSERKELKKQLAGASSDAEKTKIKKKLRMAERSQRNYDVNKRRNQSIDKRAKVLDEAGSKSDLVRADNLRSQKRSGSQGVATYKTVTDIKVKRRPKISEMNSPAKVKDPVTGKKVKGYAKADLKVSKVRDRQERKDTKKALKATAKSDGKITRLERQGINKSMRDLKTSQRNKRVVEFQKQKTKDVIAKEGQRYRNKNKKISEAIAVGYDINKAQKKNNKAAEKFSKRVNKAKKVEKRAVRNSKM